MEYTDYLQWHQLALRFLGLWPRPGSGLLNSGYGIYSLLFLGIFCVAFNVSEFVNFFFIYSELKPFASDLCWFLLHFVGSFKIAVFLYKIENVQNIFRRFKNGLFHTDFKDETIFADQAVKKSLRYLGVYYAFSLAILLNGFVAPVYREYGNQNENLNSNTTTRSIQRLPYYTYVYCDADLSPCYEIAYVYQILSTCISSLVVIHCDNLYIILVMLCCSEFKILIRSLETIDAACDYTVYETKDDLDREYLRQATNCVKHHHAILEVSEEIEDMYNLLILAQFVSHLIQICFQLFLVTEVSALSFDGLSMIAFVIAMVIEVYVFCQCGNEIETESTKVSDAAYNAQWTSYSEPVKRTLLLVMLRAQRPVRFTAGKFAKLSLGTLVSVLKGSFSYFTVLRGIQ